MLISTVHGLYKERYAYRESMTDVIVQNLITEVKVRIKCKDLVKKLAVYKNKLAVQLPDKIVIYEIESNDPKDMNYKGKKNISKKIECSLFFITSEHLVMCQDKRLECLNLKGEKVREWLMEFQVRFMKVIGGSPGKEALLISLKSGHVYEIFVDSSFPVLLLKQPNAIRYVDISMHRQKIAVIDDNSTLFVYNLKTNDLIFQEPNANSVAWNTFYEDMLAFSGNGNVSIIVSNFPPRRQRLQVNSIFF
jgi:intraflagellar transport protein 122